MRLFAVLIAICGVSQTAIAQTPECKSISDASARLACYDKTTLPAKSTAPASTKAPAAKVDRAKYVDTIAAEDALMNARLKNICRGC